MARNRATSSDEGLVQRELPNRVVVELSSARDVNYDMRSVTVSGEIIR